MARKQQYPVQLSPEERAALERVVSAGTGTARERRRAHMLLWSAAGMSDLEIAARLNVTPLTVAQTRRRWAEAHDLADRPRPGVARKLTDAQQAILFELAEGEPPLGRKRWTAQLLADQLLERGVIEAPISDETVRRALKHRT